MKNVIYTTTESYGDVDLQEVIFYKSNNVEAMDQNC